jgi:hypothetical protein
VEFGQDAMPMQEGGPVAIEQWAEVHKDAFKPPICNKVCSSVCLCTGFFTRPRRS